MKPAPHQASLRDAPRLCSWAVVLGGTLQEHGEVLALRLRTECVEVGSVMNQQPGNLATTLMPRAQHFDVVEIFWVLIQ